MKYDTTNARGSVCVEASVSREHFIIEDCKQEELARARTSDWKDVKSELY